MCKDDDLLFEFDKLKPTNGFSSTFDFQKSNPSKPLAIRNKNSSSIDLMVGHHKPPSTSKIDLNQEHEVIFAFFLSNEELLSRIMYDANLFPPGRMVPRDEMKIPSYLKTSSVLESEELLSKLIIILDSRGIVETKSWKGRLLCWNVLLYGRG